MNDSMPRREERTDEGGCNPLPWRTALLISAALGLAVAFSDAFVVLFQQFACTGGGGATLRLVLGPVAATLASTSLLYGILWFLLFRPGGRLLGLDPFSLGISLAGFLYGAYILAALCGRLRATAGATPDTRTAVLLIKIGGLPVLAAATAAVYLAVRALSRSPGGVTAARLCLAAPFLILEGIPALWLARPLFGPTGGLHLAAARILSPGPLLGSAGFLAAAAVTIFLALRAKRAAPAGRAAGALFLAALAASIATGGGLQVQGPRGEPRDMVRTGHPVPHVILIVVDTLRADALSCLGGSVSTPNIDALAADGVLFTGTYALAPWTVPSVSTILTGLAPAVHGAVHYTSLVPFEVETAAEFMRKAGYLTQAIGSQPFMTGRRDFAQGFIGYEFFPKPRNASLAGRLGQALFPRKFPVRATTRDVADRVISWLDGNAREDFFLWTHFYDPHMPYTPPKEYLPPGKAPAGIGPRFAGPLKSVRAGYLVPSLEERKWIEGLYEGEVRYVDANVGRIVGRLKKLGIYENSLIVLTSDHGEEFWEHGGFEHGHTLYNELLHVPLIIKTPRGGKRGRCALAVGNDRILPTILDLCGIPYDAKGFTGRSLAGLFDEDGGPAAEEDPIVSTGLLYYEDRESVISGGMKYIRSLLTGKEEIYDLDKDSGEEKNIAPSSPGIAAQARKILEKHKEKAAKLRKLYYITGGGKIDLDMEAVRNLKSLGYIE